MLEIVDWPYKETLLMIELSDASFCLPRYAI